MNLCKGIVVVGVVLLLIGSAPLWSFPAQRGEAYASNALVQMSQVFVDEDGNQGWILPPKIKSVLDPALALSELEITEDNYSRSGSVLVTLRKKYGVPEMDILGCVAYSWKEITFAMLVHSPGTEESFPSVAAACAISVLDNGPDPLSRPKR